MGVIRTSTRVWVPAAPMRTSSSPVLAVTFAAGRTPSSCSSCPKSLATVVLPVNGKECVRECEREVYHAGE